MRTALGIALFVFSAGFLGRSLPDSLGGSVDFVEYAAAARLLNEGKNPYSGELLLTFQQDVGWKDSKAQMMWNPPCVFPLVWPLAFVPVASGFLASNALQLGLVLTSALWCFRRIDRICVPIFIALTFAPAIFLLRLGQFSGFLLFGLAGFAHALRCNRPVAAGLAIAFTAVKPHLFLAFAFLFVAESFRNHGTRRAFVVGTIVLALASAFPFFFNAEVWPQYLNAIRAPGDEFHLAPSEWRPPILAARLAEATGGGLWMQFAPSLLATAVLAIHWFCKKNWDWSEEMPAIVLVCLLTTGYGAWGFDLVVLLVPILDVARRVVDCGNPRVMLWAATVLLMLNAGMFASMIPVILWTPLVAVFYLVIRSFTSIRTPV